jgi:hypothetical protein
MVIAPFLLPSDGDKQWGPRFFLPVIPPAIVVVTIFADDHDWQGFFRKYKGWAALSLLVIIYSVYLNVYKAGDRLRNDYSQRVYPALKYIETEPCNNIIVDNQYISQELTEEFNNKNFFLLTHEGQLANLLNELKMAGQQQCIFISVDKEKTSFPDTIMTNKNILWKPFGSYSTGIYTIP